MPWISSPRPTTTTWRSSATATRLPAARSWATLRPPPCWRAGPEMVGTATRSSSFTSTGEPGKYPSTRRRRHGTHGTPGLPGWGSVKPFVMASASQFRAPPMYGAASVDDAVKTPLYLARLRRGEAPGRHGLGAYAGPDRHRVLLDREHHPGMESHRPAPRRQAAPRAWRLARVLAHVALAEVGCVLSSFDGKYLLQLLAPRDGDPSRQPRSEHRLLTRPGRSRASSCPRSAVRRRFLTTPRDTRSPAVPRPRPLLANIEGSTAFTTDLRLAARRNAGFRSVSEGRAARTPTSRVYIGFHFRHATDMGLAAGQQVGPVRG